MLIVPCTCHFGPSCMEKTPTLETCTAGMVRWHQYWTNDIHGRVRYSMKLSRTLWTIGQPTVSYHPVSSLTIPMGVPIVGNQGGWRSQSLTRWLLCKSCLLGHFRVLENSGFAVLWFYIDLDIQLHLKVSILLKYTNIHSEYFNKDVRCNPLCAFKSYESWIDIYVIFCLKFLLKVTCDSSFKRALLYLQVTIVSADALA